MVIIYDFDGTLTPYALSHYEIFRKYGYTDEKITKRINQEIEAGKAKNFIDGWYKCYKDIIEENGLKMTKEVICMGANNIQYNNGVINYFERFQKSKTGIKHYIVTANMKDYIEATEISKYFDRIYGTTFNYDNNEFKSIDVILSEQKKIDAIKKIKEDENTENIIYFGDGFTDKPAFEYIHSIGGKNVFVLSNDNSINTFEKVNVDGIIDKCFEADYNNGSEISNYIQGLINN